MTDKTTIYIEDKEEFHRQLKQLELRYDTVLNARKSSVYEGMIRTAFNNEEEFVEHIHNIEISKK